MLWYIRFLLHCKTHTKFINLILHTLDVDHTHVHIHNILYYMYAFWGKDTSVLQCP